MGVDIHGPWIEYDRKRTHGRQDGKEPNAKHVGDWGMVAELDWHRDYNLFSELDVALNGFRFDKLTPTEADPFNRYTEYRGEPADASYEWFNHMHPRRRYEEWMHAQYNDFGANWVTVEELKRVKTNYVRRARAQFRRDLKKGEEWATRDGAAPYMPSLLDLKLAIMIMERFEKLSGTKTRLCYCYDC